MSNPADPWKPTPPEQPPTPEPEPRRPLLWLLFIAAIIGIVIAMARAFPEAVRTPDDWGSVIYSLGVVALVSAGLFRIRGRLQVMRHLRHAAIWAAIVAVLALGFAYADELEGVSQRVRIAFSGGAPVATAERELVIPRDETGSFVVVAQVNGERVRFLVDTGATETVLSPDDARRLGVDPDALNYDRQSETANGLGYGASHVAERLEVGAIRFDGFPMVVNKAPMSTSLLGMSFLDRLESYEVRGRTLTLKWRDGAG
ncbi:retropepsin-like aspartic protease family protein [Caulobacter sp. DWR1-3-2b1]|uniref:retropepsin-like aspartic protease family protein n=1 Tax=Caulobacter sp. DWR1-3-2b1 TaxID=2804670 RepID=UPI003CEAD3E3